MLSRLFIAVLWSPVWKGLTSWLLLVMFICIFVPFLFGILGHVWYLIVSFPGLSLLSYFMYKLESLQENKTVPVNMFFKV